MKSYLTKKQVAERLNLCPRSINRLMASGILPIYRIRGRIVRFDEAEIDAALASCRVPAANEPRPPKRHMTRVKLAAVGE